MTILAPLRNGSLVERLFDDWGTDSPVHTPEIQVKKSSDEYRVRAKLPGVKKEDIQLEVENGYLKISGKYEQKEEKDYESVHSEFRSYSEFQRALSLDLSRFNLDEIDANFKDGVLELSLPLKEAERPRQISIKNN